jgi:hypothetical protein
MRAREIYERRAKEIYEREGFIVWQSLWVPCEIGEVAEEDADYHVLPLGTKMVITEQISREDAMNWALRNGLPIGTGLDDGHYFYKAVAE